MGTGQNRIGVLWTDKTKFELLNKKRIQMCRRQEGQALRRDPIKKTETWRWKYINGLGMLRRNKTGSRYKIQGILVKEKMHQILIKHAIPSTLWGKVTW